MKHAVRLITLVALVAGMFVAGVSGASPAGAATTKTVRYGPYTIPAAQAGQPGMLENQLELWTTKPCTHCYITSMQPNLVDTNGNTVNVDTGRMLHHFVLASQWRSDPTCGGDWLGLVGQRFFASGNERTKMSLPPGYGYYVAPWDQWNFVYDLMNMTPQSTTVYVEVTFTYESGWSGREAVTPVWLDVDQCGDSEYSIPAGPSDTHWDWNVNVPGDLVTIGGHVHDDGVRIEAVNETTGQSLCNAVAGYGETPAYIDMMGKPRISSMTPVCTGTPVATLAQGDTVRVHSVYDSPVAQDHVMGIMIAYIA